ncbi:hypothetical protein [Chitinophaga barathri]|uniref:Uncharacterized protein n=1 Tax=Chitinophaga barathri TaxID=1647451 RepID=A0A3N4M5N9_9BACT|nr:hypothetical protein [Chitinophaga barathri]RPD38572.1 hypothetical protein EG028_25235 [Chitinophaga barathri]
MFTFLLYTLLQFGTYDIADWSKVTEFQYYGRMSLEEFTDLTKADISGKKYKVLNIDKAKNLLSHSKVFYGMIMWKGGGFLAIARFKDGSSRKILINKFGGTFRDGTGQRGYIIDERVRDEWYSFITAED